jgi:HD-like signal output (HDOD) protein
MAAEPHYQGNPQLETILGRVSELAVLPHVVYKVLELSGSSDASTCEMERAIVVDPGFSSRLLTMANSAYFALPKKVTSIREALLFLGFRSIRQLAMTVGVYDMFVGKTDKDSLRRRAWWRHSVDTAVCAKWLSARTDVPSDDAYTCGLLHYIGKSLLDRFGGAEYGATEEWIANGCSDAEAEHAVFGCSHAELAQAAAAKWGFPEELVAGLDYLTEPSGPEPYLAYRATVSLASQIASLAMGRSNAPADEDEPGLRLWALQALCIEADREAELIDGGSRAIAGAAQLQT